MTKRTLLVATVAVSLIAACGKTDSPETSGDSLIAAAPAAAPQIKHIVGFELGRQADPNGQLVGGVTDRFTVADTIVVAIKTQFTAADDEVSAVLRQGKRSIDSVSVRLPAADSTGFAHAPLRLAKAGAWAPGTYQVETFLGTMSQGIKELTIK